ncbi:MAG: hypothetical protein MJ135_02680 [Oscillospiraceae bacterium]|nr:hypothetical protein [Oscillospiraceae bacterium]
MRIGKKNEWDENENSGAIRLLSGIAKLIPGGKKEEEDAPYTYDENASDLQVFGRFIKDYLNELRKGD